jgi:putative aminopeptidase FrvX
LEPCPIFRRDLRRCKVTENCGLCSCLFWSKVLFMRDESFDFLKRLLETPSPAGFEVHGQRVWAAYAREFADWVESDSYGNVFAALNPEKSPKIVLVGHSDELGLMISHINEEGFLYFKAIGGVDRALLRGQRVIVHSDGGPIPGVTGHLAIHMQEPDDRKKVPELHEVFIDIGARSKTEAERLVRVGNPVTMQANVFRLAGDRIAARRVTIESAHGLRRRCSGTFHSSVKG